MLTLNLEDRNEISTEVFDAALPLEDLGQDCRQLINQLEIYQKLICQTIDEPALGWLAVSIKLWIARNPCLHLHLAECAADLEMTLMKFFRGQADEIDVEISKSYLTNRMTVCSQIFAIEEELVQTVWSWRPGTRFDPRLS